MFGTIKQIVSELPDEINFGSHKECASARKALQQVKIEAQKARKEVLLNRKNAILNKGN